MADERRVHDHATLYVPETGEAHDLSLGVIEVVAKAESPGKELAGLEGEVSGEEHIDSDTIIFSSWAYNVEFEDGTKWPDREFVVEARWERPKRLGYDALVVEKIVDKATGHVIVGED